MEDDIDIYEGLEDIDEHTIEHYRKENEKLLAEIAELESRIIILTEETEKLIRDKQILEKNASSLLKTAKAEVSRKDRMIIELRRQLDGNHSRRIHIKQVKPHSKVEKNHRRKATSSSRDVDRQDERKNAKPENSTKQKIEIPAVINEVRNLIDSVEADIVYNMKKEIENIVESDDQAHKASNTIFGIRLQKKLQQKYSDEAAAKERARRDEAVKVSENVPVLEDNKSTIQNIAEDDLDVDANLHSYRLIPFDFELKNLNNKRPRRDSHSSVEETKKRIVDKYSTDEKSNVYQREESRFRQDVRSGRKFQKMRDLFGSQDSDVRRSDRTRTRDRYDDRNSPRDRNRSEHSKGFYSYKYRDSLSQSKPNNRKSNYKFEDKRGSSKNHERSDRTVKKERSSPRDRERRNTREKRNERTREKPKERSHEKEKSKETEKKEKERDKKMKEKPKELGKDKIRDSEKIQKKEEPKKLDKDKIREGEKIQKKEEPKELGKDKIREGEKIQKKEESKEMEKDKIRESDKIQKKEEPKELETDKIRESEIIQKKEEPKELEKDEIRESEKIQKKEVIKEEPKELEKDKIKENEKILTPPKKSEQNLPSNSEQPAESQLPYLDRTHGDLFEPVPVMTPVTIEVAEKSCDELEEGEIEEIEESSPTYSPIIECKAKKRTSIFNSPMKEKTKILERFFQSCVKTEDKNDEVFLPHQVNDSKVKKENETTPKKLPDKKVETISETKVKIPNNELLKSSEIQMEALPEKSPKFKERTVSEEKNPDEVLLDPEICPDIPLTKATFPQIVTNDDDIKNDVNDNEKVAIKKTEVKNQITSPCEDEKETHNEKEVKKNGKVNLSKNLKTNNIDTLPEIIENGLEKSPPPKNTPTAQITTAIIEKAPEKPLPVKQQIDKKKSEVKNKGTGVMVVKRQRRRPITLSNSSVSMTVVRSASASTPKKVLLPDSTSN